MLKAVTPSDGRGNGCLAENEWQKAGRPVRYRGGVENQRLLTGSEICLRRRSGYWRGQLASDEVDLEWSGGGE